MIKRLFTLSIAALSSHFTMTSFATPTDQASSYPASASEIQYMGRIEADHGSVYMGFPGITTSITFTGESVTLNGAVEGDDAYFNVYMDGVTLPIVHFGKGPFQHTFRHYLNSEKPHTLTLVRRTESWIGVVRLDTLQIANNGTLRPSPDLPKRKMICIGDSITSGEKADLFPPDKVDSHTWNAERSYGYLLAKHFQSQINIVSYGGKGLIRDWQGDENANNAPKFFERSLPDSPTKWDHSAYVPDLVTIGLGTNDFSSGIPEHDKFVPAYIAFIDRIHEVYPNAKILLLSGPWFADGDPKKDALNSYIEEVVAHFSSEKGDFVNKHFFDETYPGSELDAHPNAVQHQAMANDIAKTISSWLDW